MQVQSVSINGQAGTAARMTSRSSVLLLPATDQAADGEAQPSADAQVSRQHRSDSCPTPYGACPAMSTRTACRCRLQSVQRKLRRKRWTVGPRMLGQRQQGGLQRQGLGP